MADDKNRTGKVAAGNKVNTANDTLGENVDTTDDTLYTTTTTDKANDIKKKGQVNK